MVHSLLSIRILRSPQPKMLAIAMAVCAACRVATCPPPEQSRSAIASEPVIGASGIRGVVLAIRDGRPLRTAVVRLSPDDARWHAVLGDGSFAIATRGSAPTALEVRARGFDGVSLPIAARGDSGLAVVAALAATRPSHHARGCTVTGAAPIDTIE